MRAATSTRSGVSLYELVTGKRPFDGDSQFAIMSAHLQGTPIPPVKVDPRLPQSLNDVILMSVAKEADERFQTAAALRNALGNVARELQPAIPQATSVRRVQPEPAAPPAPAVPAAAPLAPPPAASPESRRGIWMGLGALAAVIGIVAIIAVAPWKDTGAAPKTQVPPLRRRSSRRRRLPTCSPRRRSPNRSPSVAARRFPVAGAAAASQDPLLPKPSTPQKAINRLIDPAAQRPAVSNPPGSNPCRSNPCSSRTQQAAPPTQQLQAAARPPAAPNPAELQQTREQHRPPRRARLRHS